MRIRASQRLIKIVELESTVADLQEQVNHEQDAAKEYYHMTITAINLQRLDDGMVMVPHHKAESLYTDLEEEQVPLHLWHDWVKLRAYNYEESVEDADAAPDVMDMVHTPKHVREFRRVVTGKEDKRIRDFVDEQAAQHDF